MSCLETNHSPAVDTTIVNGEKCGCFPLNIIISSTYSTSVCVCVTVRGGQMDKWSVSSVVFFPLFITDKKRYQNMFLRMCGLICKPSAQSKGNTCLGGGVWVGTATWSRPDLRHSTFPSRTITHPGQWGVPLRWPPGLRHGPRILVGKYTRGERGGMLSQLLRSPRIKYTGIISTYLPCVRVCVCDYQPLSGEARTWT